MHFRDCAQIVHNNRINIGYNDTFSVFSKRQDNAPKRNFAVTLCHTPKQTVGEAFAVKCVTLCYTRLQLRLGVNMFTIIKGVQGCLLSQLCPSLALASSPQAARRVRPQSSIQDAFGAIRQVGKLEFVRQAQTPSSPGGEHS